MGRFHEELVNARRDGIAPPQEAQRAAEAPPAPSRSVEVSYEVSPVQGAMTCLLCYSLVSHHRVADHADVHRRAGG